MKLGDWLIGLGLLILAVLGLREFTGLPSHVVHAVDALRNGNPAGVPHELLEHGAAIAFAAYQWGADAVHHVTSLVGQVHQDFTRLLAEHGAWKLLLGVGVGVIWIAAILLFGLTWWPLMKICTTWWGKIGWSAAYVLMFGVCLKLLDRWNNWKPEASDA